MFRNQPGNNNESKYAPGHGGYPPAGGYPKYGVIAGGYHPQHGGGYAPPAIVNQPTVQSTNVAVNIGGQSQMRPWSTQLCGCMEDVGGCMCAWCFFPCFVMTLATRMQEFCLLPCCVPNALLPMRVKVRAANKIRGTICNDCYMTYCCSMLVACQMKRELDNIDKQIPATKL